MRRRVLACAAALAVFALWWLMYHHLFLADLQARDGETMELELVIERYPRRTQYGYMADARILGRRGVVFLDEDYGILRPGDRLSGSFRLTAGYSGFGWQITARIDYLSENAPVLTRAGRTPWHLYPAEWAQAINNRVDALFPARHAGFLRGLLTGDSSKISWGVMDDLYATGLVHIASVSGLHISMLAGFVMLLLRSRRLAVFVCLPLVAVFVALAGFPLSAIRSALMFALFLLAPLAARPYSSLRALVFALAVILAFDPTSILDVGLQLSFTATLGLTLFSAPLGRTFSKALTRAPWLARRPGVIRAVSSAAAASLAALVFSTPIAAYNFGRVSLISPLANLLLIPAINLVFLLTPLLLAVSVVWWPAAYILSLPVRWLMDALLWALERLGRIPLAVLYTDQIIFVLWLLLAYVCLVLGLVFRQWKAPVLTAALTLAVAAGGIAYERQRWGIEVTVLDVGRGQCVILRSGGETAVLDCGAQGANADTLAYQYLLRLGVRRVDTLLSLHASPRYQSGIPGLVKRLELTQYYYPENILEPLTEGLRLTGPTTLTVGEAALHLLPVRWGEGGGAEQGLAALVEYDDFAFLLTADIGAAGERWLLRAAGWPTGLLWLEGSGGRAGSATQELLEALKPQAVLMSDAGGRADRETLLRIAESGAALYTTAEYGSLTLRIPKRR